MLECNFFTVEPLPVYMVSCYSIISKAVRLTNFDRLLRLIGTEGQVSAR